MKDAKNSLAKSKKESGKAFLVSEKTFKEMQLMARFELPIAYIDNELYEEAIYISVYLHKAYPNNIYLKKTFAKAFYQISKDNMRSAARDIKNLGEVEGELQQVFAFSKNTSEKDW